MEKLDSDQTEELKSSYVALKEMRNGMINYATDVMAASSLNVIKIAL